MASALLLKESTARTIRFFFHHTNICWDGAAAPNSSCACPGHKAGVGKGRQLQHSSSAPLARPPSCTFLPRAVTVLEAEAKDAPGDGGSLREVLDQGLMLLHTQVAAGHRGGGGQAAGEAGGAAASAPPHSLRVGVTSWALGIEMHLGQGLAETQL